VRRSECPTSVKVNPRSFANAGDVSPVKAPEFAQCTFWLPTLIGDPDSAATTPGALIVGGLTQILDVKLVGSLSLKEDAKA
jgi:hypothetical protein